MKAALSRHATPLTTGLFIVSTVSGVALFFHLGSNLFHSMHEWLSMLLILPFALHLWKNWGAFAGYLRRKQLWLPLLLSLLAALAFAFAAASDSRGGNPAFKLSNVAMDAPISQLAPLLRSEPDALLARLRSKGLQVQSANDSVKAIAGSNHREPMAVLAVLLP